ncbi:MAG: glycosyltransferase family 2 protein [Deltaproteobacteria bacterium]|nr:glycosyltransferase family 2 protein [Deltaproteobacteria bacterium]
MSSTLSVVIAARNCADRLEATVHPWRPIAAEIIVADQMSVDATPEIAQKLGCRLFRNDPPGGNFDLNRKLAMQQATSDWVLYIDTDERPTAELLAEVRAFLALPQGPDSPDGVRIPNVFYFLGKPLRHGIYNPRSAEIRMVRKGAWDYPCEAGFHRGLSVKGRVIRFNSPYKHFNVNSLGEWFIKTNQYTEHDADRKYAELAGRETVATYGAFWRAFRFFLRHYVFKLGFLDGFHGFVAVYYFMLYHLTLDLKLWERVSQRGQREERDFLKPLELPKR